jgi:hypothetical protein
VCAGPLVELVNDVKADVNALCAKAAAHFGNIRMVLAANVLISENDDHAEDAVAILRILLLMILMMMLLL